MAYNGKRRNYRKKSTKKGTKKCRISKCIKRYVNNTIHRNIENKSAAVYLSQSYVASYANNNALTTLSMIPYANISTHGSGTVTGQASRIGNTIRTMKCIFSFVLRPNQYDVLFNTTVIPQDVYMMFGKVKNSKPQQPISTDFAKLFQAGNSTQAPVGLLDAVLPINNDWFKVYKRLMFKVGYAGANGGTGVGGVAATHYQANNDYKLNTIRRIDITKFCPKVVKFNDNTLQPTNDGLWCWIWANSCDGQTVGSRPCVIDYSIHYEYEDA